MSRTLTLLYIFDNFLLALLTLGNCEIGTFTFWGRYLTSSQKRQAFEVEAYKVQISHGAKRSSCAQHLATGYRLNLDYGTAYQLLGD